MKRFFQKNSNELNKTENIKFCMEDIAKINIRKALVESAFALGVSINLSEQPDTKQEDPLAPYLDALRGEEGFRTKMYKDTKGIPTIGVGFNLTRSDASEVFRRCFGDQCEDVLARAKDRKRGMTKDEVEKLTRYDLETTFLPRTQKAVKKFDELPLEARTALVSSAYRGSLLGSPKTLELINAGKGSDAATEYLRNREYEKAKLKGSGIAGRMEREAEGMKLIGVAPQAPAKPAKPVQATSITSSPAPAPAPAPESTSQDYEVKSGDTLSSIARRTGKTIEDIAKQNEITNPNKIAVGQKLKI